jgi:type II secretory pathway component GspD/PulD (secretin)
MKIQGKPIHLPLAAALLFCAALMAQPGDPIEAGDLLFVKVFRHPDLTTTAQVDEHGNIELKYIGNVAVTGLTENEATARVSRAFETILKNPRVTVSRSASGGMYADYSPRSEDMDTRVIPLLNSDAETVNNTLSGMTTAGGSISFDPDTNAIIITDTSQTIQKMEQVIRELDQMESQRLQVHIESRIADVESSAVKELGIRWFVRGDNLSTGYYPGARQSAKVNAVRTINDPIFNERVDASNGSNRFGGGGREFVNEPDFDRRLEIPVHVPAPGQFFLGYLNSGIDLGSLLDALVADDKAEMLATPYIRTVNHKTAEIRMTEEFPYTEMGSVGLGAVTNTRFLDVGIVLQVTPHVRCDPDGIPYVRLELAPEVSTATGVSNGVPVRSVRSSQSEADARNGQTVVIGGIIKNDSRDVIQKVPGVGNIPLVGRLFRHKEKSRTSRELMIFVTPTIYERPEDITIEHALNLTDVAGGPEFISSLEARADQPRE